MVVASNERRWATSAMNDSIVAQTSATGTRRGTTGQVDGPNSASIAPWSRIAASATHTIWATSDCRPPVTSAKPDLSCSSMPVTSARNLSANAATGALSSTSSYSCAGRTLWRCRNAVATAGACCRRAAAPPSSVEITPQYARSGADERIAAVSGSGDDGADNGRRTA